MDKSLAAQLSADQGDARAELAYGFLVDNGKGIPINKSRAAYYSKLLADQGNAQAQFNYGFSS
jgi:TPR repeat protein